MEALLWIGGIVFAVAMPCWFFYARSRRDSMWSMREVSQMIEGRRDAAPRYDGKTTYHRHPAWARRPSLPSTSELTIHVTTSHQRIETRNSY
jgi:hypothetical protein